MIKKISGLLALYISLISIKSQAQVALSVRVGVPAPVIVAPVVVAPASLVVNHVTTVVETPPVVVASAPVVAVRPAVIVPAAAVVVAPRPRVVVRKVVAVHPVYVRPGRTAIVRR